MVSIHYLTRAEVIEAAHAVKIFCAGGYPPALLDMVEPTALTLAGKMEEREYFRALDTLARGVSKKEYENLVRKVAELGAYAVGLAKKRRAEKMAGGGQMENKTLEMVRESARAVDPRDPDKAKAVKYGFAEKVIQELARAFDYAGAREWLEEHENNPFYDFRFARISTAEECTLEGWKRLKASALMVSEDGRAIVLSWD